MDIFYSRIYIDAMRYRHLRSKDVETIYDGGVFAGMTPENFVLNLDDLDLAIDKEMESNDAKISP